MIRAERQRWPRCLFLKVLRSNTRTDFLAAAGRAQYFIRHAAAFTFDLFTSGRLLHGRSLLVSLSRHDLFADWPIIFHGHDATAVAHAAFDDFSTTLLPGPV